MKFDSFNLLWIIAVLFLIISCGKNPMATKVDEKKEPMIVIIIEIFDFELLTFKWGQHE